MHFPPRRVFKHGGWERMGLRNRSRILAPGNRLQPLDELAGAKKASPYGGVLPPSPYASLRKCKRFLGNIRTTAVLKSALQVSLPLLALQHIFTQLTYFPPQTRYPEKHACLYVL